MQDVHYPGTHLPPLHHLNTPPYYPVLHHIPAVRSVTGHATRCETGVNGRNKVITALKTG